MKTRGKVEAKKIVYAGIKEKFRLIRRDGFSLTNKYKVLHWKISAADVDKVYNLHT